MRRISTAIRRRVISLMDECQNVEIGIVGERTNIVVSNAEKAPCINNGPGREHRLPNANVRCYSIGNPGMLIIVCDNGRFYIIRPCGFLLLPEKKRTQ